MKSILLSCAAVLAMTLTPVFAQELAIGETAPMPDAPSRAGRPGGVPGR